MPKPFAELDQKWKRLRVKLHKTLRFLPQQDPNYFYNLAALRNTIHPDDVNGTAVF